MTNKVILPIQSSYLLSVKVILIPLFMCVCPKNTMVYRMAYVQNVLACFLKSTDVKLCTYCTLFCLLMNLLMPTYLMISNRCRVYSSIWNIVIYLTAPLMINGRRIRRFCFVLSQ